MPPLTAEEREWLREWLADPERKPVLTLIREWPPGCKVTSHEDAPLMIPAPGIVGTVVSWFEAGTVGVLAPMAEARTSPITRITLEAGEQIRGECDPARLVFLEEGDITRADIEATLAAEGPIEGPKLDTTEPHSGPENPDRTGSGG